MTKDLDVLAGNGLSYGTDMVVVDGIRFKRSEVERANQRRRREDRVEQIVLGPDPDDVPTGDEDEDEGETFGPVEPDEGMTTPEAPQAVQGAPDAGEDDANKVDVDALDYDQLKAAVLERDPAYRGSLKKVDLQALLKSVV